MIFTCSNARSGSPVPVEGAEVARWWGKETWSRKGPFPAISGCLLASQLWRLRPTHASLFLGTHKGWGRNGFSFLLNWLKFLTKDIHSLRFLLAWWPGTGQRGLAASWAHAWDELGAGGTGRQKGAQERAGECPSCLWLHWCHTAALTSHRAALLKRISIYYPLPIQLYRHALSHREWAGLNWAAKQQSKNASIVLTPLKPLQLLFAARRGREAAGVFF